MKRSITYKYNSICMGIFVSLCPMMLLLAACDENENESKDNRLDTATDDITQSSDSNIIGTDSTVKSAGTDTDTDTNLLDTSSDNVDIVKPATGALVITTDYQTGAYSSVSLDGATVQKDIEFIHSDSVCHVDDVTGIPYILLRLGSDAVDVLDPATLGVTNEYSVEPASNPHDIEVVFEDKAYITRFGLSQILIVNPITGVASGVVDLSTYADSDGIPEISGMAQMNGKLYVAVSRLNRDNSWEPVGDSYIVIIDAVTGAVESDIQVHGTNIVGQPEYSAALGKFVISQVGSYGTLDDGGVQLLDPAAKTLSAFVATEAVLGGSLNKVICSAIDKCFAVIGVSSDSGSNTHVVTFNPQTGQKTGTIAVGAGWVYSDIVLTDDNSELWLADRTADSSGVRIFDAATNTEKTVVPINVGLPPGRICFTR